MADHESRIKQQVKNKIKVFNKQRAGLSIIFIIFIGILFFLPTAGTEALSVRLPMFCSSTFLLCSAAFVLSFRDLLLLLIVATGIPTVLLGLGQIHFELFLILFLTNAGTAFIASITGKAITLSFKNEIEEINRLKIEATTDALTHLLNRNGLEQAAGIAWALCKRGKKKVGVL